MQIKENVSLQPYTTFGVSETAKLLTEVHTVEELVTLLDHKEAKENTLLPLGGGSNILLTRPVDALVILNRITGVELVKEDDNFYYVSAGAGVNWHQLVLTCLQNGWGGLENLSLIPGNVGAAPMQNIGAYGAEIKDSFWRLDAVDIETGEVLTFNANDCEFGYRTSIFKTKLKGKTIITKVGFKLPKSYKLNTSYGAIEKELEALGVSSPTMHDVSKAVINIRSSKLPDPKKIGNAGSFFKNPIVPVYVYEEIKNRYPHVPSYPVSDSTVKVPAGWLIDTLGWKGKTIDGRYGVHKNQALVLVHYQNAKGQEIYNLSEQIVNDVKKEFNIELEREVNIL